MVANTFSAPGIRPEAKAQTRRDIFAAAGATALAGIAAASFIQPETLRASGGHTHLQDGALIALCAQMDALEHRYVALSDAEPEDMDEHLSEISSAQYPIVMKISATRAATIHGLRAKAASLLLWAVERQSG